MLYREYNVKSFYDDNLEFSTDPCYIQNHAITNHVMKRIRIIMKIADAQADISLAVCTGHTCMLVL